MAKRRKQKDADAPLTPKMRKHLESLGFWRRGFNPDWCRDRYLDWCRDRGFAPRIDKSATDVREESEAKRRESELALARTRVHRNPRKLILQACADEVLPEEIQRPGWRQFLTAIRASRPDADSRKALAVLLLTVHDRADFLFETTSFGGHSYRYINALIRLNDRRGQWIRPLDDWRPGSHNRDRQFTSLARHITALYDVPRFMDSAWFRSDRGAHRLRDWFIHIGSGKNIRTAKTPVPLTKRQAHCFLQAPDSYGIENAIRWGQIHALGGDARLADAVCGTMIGENFENDDFWAAVQRFFVTNPLLDRRHVGPIVDYLNHQRFVTREVVTGPGVVEQQPPEQPNLTMRGRTAESLLRQTNEWHGKLARSKQVKELWFRPSGVKGLETRAGKNGFWRIRELLSGAELIDEGRKMRHCVATYAQSCAAGECSIWSIERHTSDGVEKRQTVEVNRHGVIVQSRGRLNRLPNQGEYDLLRQWSREAGTSISPYVHVGD